MEAGAAAAIATEALIWLAGQDEALAAFLAAGGLSADEIRPRADDPEFLGFTLDFLLSDEALLLAFCADSGVPPEAPSRARAALPGGDAPHWT